MLIGICPPNASERSPDRRRWLRQLRRLTWEPELPGTGVPRKDRSMTVAPEQAESSTRQSVHTRALIIGTGFSGLCMAIELQRRGVEYLILEEADEIGGT